MTCMDELKKSNVAQTVAKLYHKIMGLSYAEVKEDSGYVYYRAKDKQRLDAVTDKAVEDLALMEALFSPALHTGKSLQELATFAKAYRGKLGQLSYADLIDSVGYRHFTKAEKEKLACLDCAELDTPIIVSPKTVEVWTLENE